MNDTKATPASRGTTAGGRVGRLAALAVVLAVGLLSGCDLMEGEVEPNPAAQQQAQQAQQANPAQQAQQAQQAATAEPAAEQEEYTRPEYPEGMRRNPFLPDPEVFQPQRSAPEDVRRLEPLEQFAIGSLELVAIISEVAVPKAMFIDPQGFGHVVKEGDRIGRNSGVITDIRDNEVEVRETTDDLESQTRMTTVVLQKENLRGQGDGDELSEREREILEKLLESEEGREALQKRFEERAPGAAASERQQPAGQAAPDGRFGGSRPPSN